MKLLSLMFQGDVDAGFSFMDARVLSPWVALIDVFPESENIQDM